MTIIVCGYTRNLKEKINYAEIMADLQKEEWSFQDGKIIDANGSELDDIPPRKKYERLELNHQNYELILDDSSLYTTNFTEPLSYQDSAFLKLPKFP